MPPAGKIERVRRVLIALAIITVAIIIATSGTRYIELEIPFILLPAWFAMAYFNRAMRSYARYVRTAHPVFYESEARSLRRRWGLLVSPLRRWDFSTDPILQLWPYTFDTRPFNIFSATVKPEVVEFFKDPEYVASLQGMLLLAQTSLIIGASEMGLSISFAFLKLWQ